MIRGVKGSQCGPYLARGFVTSKRDAVAGGEYCKVVPKGPFTPLAAGAKISREGRAEDPEQARSIGYGQWRAAGNKRADLFPSIGLPQQHHAFVFLDAVAHLEAVRAVGFSRQTLHHSMATQGGGRATDTEAAVSSDAPLAQVIALNWPIDEMFSALLSPAADGGREFGRACSAPAYKFAPH